MKYQIISGYSKDTPYEKEAEFLKESLVRFGMSTDHIVGFENQGSWEKNCQYKAVIIKNKLKELRTPIVWIDCDAVLEKEPILFNTIKHNIAFCKYEGNLLSGTLYFKPTKSIHTLIEHWVINNNLDPKAWDQRVLHRTIERWGMNYYELPLSYCKIDGLETEDTVIAQNQASRRFKKIINSGSI